MFWVEEIGDSHYKLRLEKLSYEKFEEARLEPLSFAEFLTDYKRLLAQRTPANLSYVL